MSNKKTGRILACRFAQWNAELQEKTQPARRFSTGVQVLLRESELRLYEVANQVGYKSDLAFAKAFK